VEWLNDRSCNIHFADDFSAARAFNGFFKELPCYEHVVEEVKKLEAQIEVKKEARNKVMMNMNQVLNKAMNAATVARTKKQQEAAAAAALLTKSADENEDGKAASVVDGVDDGEKKKESTVHTDATTEEVGTGSTKKEPAASEEEEEEVNTKDDEINSTSPKKGEEVEALNGSGTDGSDSVNQTVAAAAEEEEVKQQQPFRSRTEDFSDLSVFGWKLGPPMSKQQNKGLSCRLICRYSYDFDVLMEKPKKPVHQKRKNREAQPMRPAVSLNGALPSSYRPSTNNSGDDVANIKVKSFKTSHNNNDDDDGDVPAPVAASSE
jgi:hypothetical protein